MKYARLSGNQSDVSDAENESIGISQWKTMMSSMTDGRSVWRFSDVDFDKFAAQ